MPRIVIELPLDRNHCGSLLLLETGNQVLCGPFAVAGRASDALARTHENPARNPLLRFGDTPAGTYCVREITASGAGTPFPAAAFGCHGLIVLEAVSGDAALADANGRYRFFIQAGAAGPNGGLRATAGALRLGEDDQAALVAMLAGKADVRCYVVAHAAAFSRGAVFDDGTCDEEDPPSLPGDGSPVRELFGDVSRRAALRSGAIGMTGLTALSLSVSFVSLGGVTPARAYTQMAYNEAPAQSHTEVGPGDERTTGGGENPIQGGGQPIGGAGVTQGAPDTPPPPNPGTGVAAPTNPAYDQAAHGPNWDGAAPSNASEPTVTVPSTPAPSAGTPIDSSGAQPVGGAGVTQGAPDTPPPPNPGSGRIAADRQAVANAQAQLDAAIAKRNAATSDLARQQAQIEISDATQELNRANSQLRADEINGN